MDQNRRPGLKQWARIGVVVVGLLGMAVTAAGVKTVLTCAGGRFEGTIMAVLGAVVVAGAIALGAAEDR